MCRASKALRSSLLWAESVKGRTINRYKKKFFIEVQISDIYGKSNAATNLRKPTVVAAVLDIPDQKLIMTFRNLVLIFWTRAL